MTTPVFIHGLGQTPASWEKTIACLGCGKALCPSLPDLLSGREVHYTQLYASFAAYCNALDGPLDLCGLSLGGVLALHYAAEHPERVRSLVLIGAQYHMPKRLLQFQNLLFRFMPGSMFEQMGFGKADFLRLCSSMMELDFTASLSRITCPTLVICGEKDSANKKAALELSDLLPNATLRIIQGAGHEVNTDTPEALADAIHAFYTEGGPHGD